MSVTNFEELSKENIEQMVICELRGTIQIQPIVPSPAEIMYFLFAAASMVSAIMILFNSCIVKLFFSLLPYQE